MDTRCYQLGIVGLRLSSDLPEPLEDCDSLYGVFRVQRVAHPALEISVYRRRSRPWSRSSYALRCAGRESIIGRDRRAILPEIEAAVTRQVLLADERFVPLSVVALARGGQAMLLGEHAPATALCAAGLLRRGWQHLSGGPALINPLNGWVQPFPKALLVGEEQLPLAAEHVREDHILGPYVLRGKRRCYYLPPWRRDVPVLASACPACWLVQFGRESAEPASIIPRCACVQIDAGSIEEMLDMTEQAIGQGGPPPAAGPRADAPGRSRPGWSMGGVRLPCNVLRQPVT